VLFALGSREEPSWAAGVRRGGRVASVRADGKVVFWILGLLRWWWWWW
jgi:hypothetical protein